MRLLSENISWLCMPAMPQRWERPEPSSVSPVHIYGLVLVIAVPADALAPGGARPSADTLFITKPHMRTFKVFGY